MTARYLIGDVLEVLPTLEAGSVDLVLTSPPFLALRSYLPADHPDKAKEGGSQPTPGAFIDWLVDVVEALDRVLAPHGSMVIELGDTYAGSGYNHPLGGLAHYNDERGNPAGMRDTTFSGANTRTGGGSGWPADKSLTLIPELFRMTLVYGFNPLTGRQTKRWRLRNVIRWVRPNPPVGALGDKFRPATSELMVFCRTDEAGRRRYFDLDAVRTPNERTDEVVMQSVKRMGRIVPGSGPESKQLGDALINNPAGAPPLDWWNIPLLDGEEPTPYGPAPKEKKDITQGVTNKALRHSPTKGNSWGDDEVKRLFSNPNGAPPLDWWNIPPGGYVTSPTRLNPGEYVGGTLYIASAGCPLHEGRLAPAPTAPHDEPVDSRSSHNPDNGGSHVQGLLLDSVPTVPPPALPPEVESSDSTNLPYVPAAKPRSKASNRTAPAPATNSPDNASDRTPYRTGGTSSESPSGERHPDKHGSRISELDPALLALDNYARTGHKPPELEPCSCSFYVRKPNDTSHYADNLGVPLDWWEIVPGGFSGAHYAVFPEALCVRPIKAMCPERVCRTCGEPSRRITETLGYVNNAGRPSNNDMNQPRVAPGVRQFIVKGDSSSHRIARDVGFTDCSHDNYRPGLVLDPFAGSGTTLAVAVGHGRDAVGIDLDDRNLDLARERLGMFLEVVDRIP